MRSSLAVAVSLLVAGPAAAQLTTVRGIVYDSLRGAPLADAFVTLDGGRSTMSDGGGRFLFDSVAPGPHAFAMQHEMLDSAGFSGILTRATIRDGEALVVVSTPSFATLWRRTCGAERVEVPGAESGIVFGTVTDAGGEHAVANAGVALTWTRVGSNPDKHIVQRRSRLDATSSTLGAYGICGVPLDVGVRLQATTPGAASGIVDLGPTTLRVRRRDVRVAPVTTSARGTIVGIVTDTSGVPIANARIVMDESPEVRTSATGQFTIRDVPIGTRQLEVIAIGLAPVTSVVDVMAGETATVTARLRRVTQLEVMRVTASPRVRRLLESFEERRIRGMGRIRDSTALQGRGTMAAVFSELPGVVLQYARGTSSSRFTIELPNARGGRCFANLLLDGVMTEQEDLDLLRPTEIAAIEVYARSFEVPPEVTTRNPNCGVVAVWTKRFFR